MVALSLYRGNLHRVPDVPRRWLMPTPKISLRDFKSLLTRRSKALSRLRSSTSAIAIATTSNPIPDPNNSNHNGAPPELPVSEPEKDNRVEKKEPSEAGPGPGPGPTPPEIKIEVGLDGGNCLAEPGEGGEENKAETAEKDGEDVKGDGNLEVVKVEKPDELANPNIETMGKANVLSDKEKRKKEVEEKLEVLTAKKHNLVQALKQILNVEEELKRQTSTQGMAIRPSGPLQVDVTNDSGSMTRLVTPRIGSETNLGGDMEGGEAEDVSNHNLPSRYLHRMSSTSPSSESPLRRPPSVQHNVVPHCSRTSLGISSSPSRFAPTGHLGNSSNLPAVSLSGTNYVASSPSPAASGGSSAFRDARQPSPWN